MSVSPLPHGRRLGVLFASLFAVALGACADSSPAPEAHGSTQLHELSGNDQTAFDFFLGKGLSAEQAAGVVGNLDQESGMDPSIAQGGGGPGRGIAQWSAGGRWDTGAINCTDFAAQQGKDVHDLQLQLDFIWYELNQEPRYGLQDLQSASSVEDAVSVFQDKYEICGACANGNRVKFAQDALDAFGSDAPASSGPSKPSPTTGDDDDDDDDTVIPTENAPDLTWWHDRTGR
jgi:hypothetical protein